MLHVTRARGPGDAAFYNREIGVCYDRYRDGGRWAILNEDGAPIPDGAAFNVAVEEGSPPG